MGWKEDSSVRRAVLGKSIDRLQATILDAVLLGITLLMLEFLFLAFSGRRGPTGLLLSAEQILDLLHYSWSVVGGLILALMWNLFYRHLGASPGRAWVRGVPDWEAPLAWNQTLRGWSPLISRTVTWRLACWAQAIMRRASLSPLRR